MMTKDEIQRDIRDLTYQYQSLIREGSYKLAQIRKERIKKLKEQLKQLNKAKVQDSMDVLKLCGYAADASIQVGPWMIYQEGNEISVHRGGRAWAQGFKSVQEAKAWIKQKEYWIETGKDEWPTFTKGSKDDDATEHGSIEQYGKGTKTESMGLSDDPVLAQDGFEVKQDAEGYYWVVENGKIINGPYTSKEKAKMNGKPNVTKAQDGGPGSGIKGHRTPEKEEPKKAKSGSKEENSSTNKSESNGPYKVYSTSSKEEKARIAIANKFPEGTYIKSPGGRILKVTHSDPYENQLFLKVVSGSQKGKEGLFDYKALTEEGITKVDPSEIKSKPAKKNKLKDSWNSVYEKAFGNQSVNTLESLKSQSDVIRHFQKLGIDPNSVDAKEAMRRWFNSDSKPVKDSDPKVAEAQAIINLCGGIY